MKLIKSVIKSTDLGWKKSSTIDGTKADMCFFTLKLKAYISLKLSLEYATSC